MHVKQGGCFFTVRVVVCRLLCSSHTHEQVQLVFDSLVLLQTLNKVKHCEREMNTILSSVYSELRSDCFSPEKVGFPLLKGLPWVFFFQEWCGHTSTTF